MGRYKCGLCGSGTLPKWHEIRRKIKEQQFDIYKTDLKESGELCKACRVGLIKTTKKLENLEKVSDEQTPVRGKRHVTLKSIRKKQLLFNLGLNIEESRS